MKKLILHVGLHKTGSTAVQALCHVNRDRLVDLGYYYPRFSDAGWENHSVPLSIMFMSDPLRNHTVTDLFKTYERCSEVAQEMRINLAREISSTNANHIILSGEDVSIFSNLELLNFKRFITTIIPNVGFQVVIYVRDPVSWTMSNAQMWVKVGKRSLGQILKLGSLLQAKPKIEKFRSVFGDDCVNVFSVEDAIHNTGDVAKHFLQFLGVSGKGFKFHRLNEAMPLEKILVVSALIRIEPLLVHHALQSIPDTGSRFRASKAVIKYIHNHAKEDIDYLAKTYGIHYNMNPNKTEDDICIDRSRLLRNIYIVRNLSKEKLGRDLPISDLFEAICSDIGCYFPYLERFIVAMAYNLTLSPKLKDLLDQWLERDLVHGKYIHGLFMLKGDELDPDNFPSANYLAANPDVAEAGVDPFLHYYSCGRFEGRKF